MASLSTASHNFKFDVQATLMNVLDSGAVASATMSAELIEDAVSSGVSANEIDRVWEETIEITSGSTVTLDLRTMSGRDIGAGTGKDALGQTLAIEEISMLIIAVTDGTGILEINKTVPSDPLLWIPQNAARNSYGGGVRAGGFRLWYEPDTVGLDTDTLEKNVNLGATGGNVTVRVLVFGRHDDDESSSSSASSSSSSSSSTS